MPRRASKRNSSAMNRQPDAVHYGSQPMHGTILLIGGIILLLLLVYTIIPLITPFVLIASILFLLYPLRHEQLSRTVIWLAVALFVLWFIYSLGGVLFPFIVAFLIAYLLDPFINRLQRWGVARWLSSLIVILIFLGAVVTFLLFIMPIALSQFQGIIDGISGIVGDVINYIQQRHIFETLAKYGFPMERFQSLLTEKFTPRLETILRSLLEGAFSVISSVSTLVTHLVNAVIIPFLAFYMMKDFPTIVHRFKMIMPRSRREIIAENAVKVDALFGRYLRGAITVAFIHGILASVLLWMSGIRYPLVLGIVAGVLSLIPYFGLLTSLSVSLLVALFSGEPVMLKVLFVLITFAFLQVLEFSVLSPNILGKQIGLHPVLIILSLLVFGYFLGFVGLLIAVPTTAILIMLIKEWEQRRRTRQLAAL